MPPPIRPNQQALYVSENQSNLAHWTSGYGTENLVKQLFRVTNISNWGFQKQGDFLNQIGTYDTMGYLSPTNPSVSLQFDYYLTDYYNESKLGFSFADTGDAHHMLKDLYYSEGFPKNYFILTKEDGSDANYSNLSGTKVCAIGDGVITNYSMRAGVGSFPSASINIEALNYLVDDYSSSSIVKNPSTYSDKSNVSILLPDPTPSHSLDQPKVINPGDISINISNDFLGIKKETILIQSFDFSLPLPRKSYRAFGDYYPRNRFVSKPAQYSVGLDFFVRDMITGDLSLEDFCQTSGYDIDLVFKKRCATGCDTSSLAFSFHNLFLQSLVNSQESNSRQRTSVSFVSQFGDTDNLDHGAFIWSGFDFRSVNDTGYSLISGTHTGNYLNINPSDRSTLVEYYSNISDGGIFASKINGYDDIDTSYEIKPSELGDYTYNVLDHGSDQIHSLNFVTDDLASGFSGGFLNLTSYGFSNPPVCVAEYSVSGDIVPMMLSGTTSERINIKMGDGLPNTGSIFLYFTDISNRCRGRKYDLKSGQYSQKFFYGNMFTGREPTVFTMLEYGHGDDMVFIDSFVANKNRKYAEVYFTAPIPNEKYKINFLLM